MKPDTPSPHQSSLSSLAHKGSQIANLMDIEGGGSGSFGDGRPGSSKQEKLSKASRSSVYRAGESGSISKTLESPTRSDPFVGPYSYRARASRVNQLTKPTDGH